MFLRQEEESQGQVVRELPSGGVFKSTPCGKTKEVGGSRVDTSVSGGRINTIPPLLVKTLLAAILASGAVYAADEVKTPVEGSFVGYRGIQDFILPIAPLFLHEELVSRIVQCESGWNPEAKNPTSTAYGLGQFLESTWEAVQVKWGMELDRYDEKDQLYATERLLLEEGIKHWRASQDCWNQRSGTTLSEKQDI